MNNSAVVIVNYNDSKRILELVNVLKSYDFLKKIVISDNNSSDEERKLIAKAEDDVVHIVFNNANLGFSGANNSALEFLKNENIDYVFTINSDVMVSKETMLKSIEFLKEHEDISLVSAEMNEYGEKKQCFYNFPTITHAVAENIGFIKVFKIQPKIREQYNNYYVCDYIRSSYWCVKYKDFADVKFFDTNTFLYHVETCVGIKLFRNNKKCAILSQETYEHNHIYKDGYKIRGYKDSYKSLLYIFKTYYKKNAFQIFMYKCSYYFGLGLRKAFGIK